MFENPTVNLNALCNPCAKIAFFRLSWFSRFFMQAAASKMRASNSSCVSTFILQTSLFIQPHKEKSNGLWSGDQTNSDSSISVKIQS